MEAQSSIDISQRAGAGNGDKRLIADVLAKDRKATAEFVSLCADWTYSFVRGRLAPRSDLVEDLMQEILLAAWQALPNFRGVSSLRNWILGIARHKVDDYYRRRLRETEFTEDEQPIAEPAVRRLFEEQLDSFAQGDRVQKTLAKLPEPYAMALIWRYRDEKSAREMARFTGKTEKAIERLLARARDSFRKRWNDERS